MPTYEYVCEKCSHKFDIVQPITAKALSVCPRERCVQKRWGKGKVKRVIVTGGGLIFKGTGFYTTDYRSENYQQAAKKDVSPAPATKESPATTTAPTTSGPASKPEPKPKPAPPAKKT